MPHSTQALPGRAHTSFAQLKTWRTDTGQDVESKTWEVSCDFGGKEGWMSRYLAGPPYKTVRVPKVEIAVAPEILLQQLWQVVKFVQCERFFAIYQAQQRHLPKRWKWTPETVTPLEEANFSGNRWIWGLVRLRQNLWWAGHSLWLCFSLL